MLFRIPSLTLPVLVAANVIACTSSTGPLSSASALGGGSSTPAPAASGATPPTAMGLAGDCDQSDTDGQLVAKANAGTLFAAALSYRQTNDQGEQVTAACNLSTHQVTSAGMADVALHCSGKSQAAAGYARVAARWGTSRTSPSCSGDYCAVIYVDDGSGNLKEAARDIHLQDRFYCTQTKDRVDARLDVDACTYADVVGALKGTGASTDQSNLTFDGNGKLTGYAGKGLTLHYRMYACAAGAPASGGGGSSSGGSSGGGSSSGGSSGGGGGSLGSAGDPAAGGGGAGTGGATWGGAGTGCDDVPPDGTYTCAQQAGWGKCGETWMHGFGHASCGTCP